MECFKARRCRIGGIEGDWGISRVVALAKSEVLVLRLSWLGFLFMAGIFGLMKEGDEGSETSEEDNELLTKGGCIERPFMFRARRGEGEVIGRARFESETVRPPIEGRPPKLEAG